jgi:multiple sugar transport system permease protein
LKKEKETLWERKISLLDKYAKPIFVTPGLLMIISLIIYPTAYLFFLAFCRYDLATMREPIFVGLFNFQKILSDSYFLVSFQNTLILSSIAVTIEFFLGLGLALVLNEKIKGRSFFRTLFILPMMIPPVVAGLNFKLLFDEFGPLEAITVMIGIGKLHWRSNPLLAKLAIVLTDTWQWSPFMFIILLAGLQAIPDYLYDAAKIDGLSAWQTFKYVTWPMLVPAIVAALVFRVMDSFKIFDIVFMLTFGGPAQATEVLSFYIYRTGFRYGYLGYASAMALIVLIVLSLIAYTLIKLTRLERRMGWS